MTERKIVSIITAPANLFAFYGATDDDSDRVDLMYFPVCCLALVDRGEGDMAVLPMIADTLLWGESGEELIFPDPEDNYICLCHRNESGQFIPYVTR